MTGPFLTNVHRRKAAPGAPTIYVSDEFTDDDDTLLINHTPDIDVVGTGWWDPHAPARNNIKIQTNQANTGLENVTVGLTIDSGQADVEISFRYLMISSDSSGLCFRTTDVRGDFIRVQSYPNSDIIIKSNSTTYADFTLDPPVTPGNYYSMKVRCEGTTIKFYFEGTERWSGTIAEKQTVTRHGFYGRRLDQFFDDFLVQSLT